MADGGPLRSMTGFGRGSAANRTASVEAELRAVNGRALNLKLRLPPDRAELESKVEALVRAEVDRGSVQGQVRVQLLEGRGSVIDRGVLARYLAEWRAAAQEVGLADQDPSLSDLLSLPGAVLQPPESSRASNDVRRAVLEAVGLALNALQASREKEGEKLRRELLGLAAKLEKALDRAEKRLPAAQQAAAARLKDRVEAAWKAAGVTEPMDLTRELVVLAERADVREEVARLRIHLERVRALLAAGGPCGRELEFVIQECHREVTTLGNKSADAKLSEHLVAMKLLVGQLKEQTANVE
jgi:uncharacterized protein (TIGR00255 family)